MLEFINNEWVIGIVGALVSGTILVPITYKITKILEKAKIPAEVKKCNKEILSILRRIVSEGEAITFEIIEVLIDSVSRANSLDKELVNTPEMFVQDLILDIYDSSYIPMNNKVNMTSKLQSLLSTGIGEKRVPQRIKLRKSEIIFVSLTTIFSIIFAAIGIFIPIKLLWDTNLVGSSLKNVEEGSQGSMDVIAAIAMIFGITSVVIAMIRNTSFSNGLASFFGLSREDDYEGKGKGE